ncbi:SusC/RagA family TonB-linked outer membrane protein [Mucilaginibacter paludis]|uniref:TonB-dependent receptor plug n=1 Tax=Mucilaginibacter paludis DSM 18603 TaxID=714943 RepID=H1Y293_9SPHI|nr:TonB-dependent receptor [Mucilaginibacter paludis]EHQ27873.1 TonB-dependent receptor plug [Mucilaginibacter paludis DSM 18603]
MMYHLLKTIKIYRLPIIPVLCMAGHAFADGGQHAIIASNVGEPRLAIVTKIQEITVTGSVTDEAGILLPGVTIKVKGTAVAKTTDGNGKFKLTVTDPNSILVFSFIGYDVQEVPLRGLRLLKVQLKPSSKSLNEVVVVGYGTQRRASITGAISSVNAATLTALPVASIDGALQGRVAGLNVTSNGGPGSSPVVSIRGISSISFGSDPLYVVDGFPLAGGLNGFDSKDVDNVQVLKDASAAAIYGSRATNGVILISTKKGTRNGKISINFDASAGVQSPAKYYNLLNTNQYVQYATALDGTNLPPRLQPANFNAPIYAGAAQTYAQTNTDWQHEYFVRNALITTNSFSLSGGNDVSRFYSAIGYYKQNGIAQAQTFERLNYRINSDHIVSKYFTFGQNLYIAGSTQHYDATQGNRTPITNVVRMLPYIPLHDPTTAGGFQGPISSFDGSDPTNPVEAALIGNNQINSTNIFGTAYVDVNIVSWLRFRSTFGANYLSNYTSNYTPIYNDGGTLNASSASVAYQRQNYFTRLGTQQLTFDNTFGNHHITALAVYEQQTLHYINQLESGTQNTNQVQTLNGAGNIAANNTNEDNFLQSLVGRLTYDYQGKYLVNASIRRDGLSVWAPSHKSANFPAVSVGWNINKENFLKDNRYISEFKLRGGYGVTGINPSSVGNYPSVSLVQINQAYYPVGNASASGNANSSYTNGLTNPDLNWERTKQANIGLDLGILENKFTIVAEYYRRQTDNLILNVPTPTSFGFLGTGALINIGAMRNTGFEFQLGYHKTKGDFKYDVTGLISAVSNKIVSLNTPNASIPSGNDPDFGGGDAFTNTVAGQSVQYFYGWVTDGIFQNAAQVASSPKQVGAAPGDIKFKDISGPNGVPDGVIDNYDRTNLGSFLPNFTYSLNYSASYKNFDVAIFFQGVQGNKVLNAERIILEGMPRLFNAGTAVLNAWTPSNTSTDMPRAINSDPNRNGRLSSRWIEDGSYLRLKNVMLGYKLSPSVISNIQKVGVKSLRLYVSSQNLFTITGYKGLDPEIGSKNGTLTNGVDFGQYPTARSFQFGIQAGF